jgi:carbon-monoxide dehydrogenase medium subunit
MRLEYFSPTSYADVVELLREFGTDAKIVAGGTDLMIQMERGQAAPRALISLDHIPAWDALHTGASITMGAGTTYRQLEKSLAPSGPYAALVEASRQVGGVQIRNVATLAGNLCNASPAADSVPPLMVMDATLTITGTDGKRSVSIDKFLLEPGRTILGASEVLTQIHVPELPARSATVFLKAGRRRAMEISFASVAARITLAADGETIQTARIALGAVAPTPIRAIAAEQILEGQSPTPQRLREAAQLAASTAQPISDVRASAEYRQHLVAVMVERAVRICRERVT